MRKSNKKGISEMIGYVLLISFAVIMSGIVYIWMKSYVPVDAIQCPDSVSVMVDNLDCVGGNLSLTLKNNGLFNIDGLFIKAAFKPGEEIAVNNLLVDKPGGFIQPRGEGLLVEEGKNKDLMIFQYDEKVCTGKKQCGEKYICLGGYICPLLIGNECNDVSETFGLNCNNDTGKCLGTAKCQDLISDNCNSLLITKLNVCGGWSLVNYYNISAIEITPVVYMEYKNKNRFVTCGNSKIREEISGCSVYKIKTT